MQDLIHQILDTDLNAWITLGIGLFTGSAITLLYCIDTFRQNKEMRQKLGRE